MNVVIFQVEALNPGILPREALVLDKHVEQPAFGDPINATDKQVRFPFQSIQGESPNLQDPIGFIIGAVQVTMRLFKN